MNETVETIKEIKEDEGKIDWSMFDDTDRLKVETNKTYEIGFSNLRATIREVQDRATGQSKQIPAIELDIDYLNGEKVQKKMYATAKNFVVQLKMLYEKNLLFTSIFQLTKQGEGFQTKYFLVAVRKK